jgi:uncharacterized protein (TIGR03437 family)
VDLAGNSYVVGTTGSLDFPGAPPASHAPISIVNSGDLAAFVAKFNPAGSALSYATYLGSPYGNQGKGIAIDSSGVAYVTGNDLNHIIVAKLDGPYVFPVVKQVVNSASYAFSAAPGSIASVLGEGLGGSAGESVMVFVSQAKCLDTAVPLLYVSPNQINFQVPWELCASGRYVTALGVSVNGLVSDTENGGLIPASFSPGIFTINASGSGQGAVLLANSAVLAAPARSVAGLSSRPAKPGEYITIFCTGLGPVTNQPGTGMKTPTSPLSQTTTPATVKIGGMPAQVAFSGLAPSFIGLYQVNVQVPENAPAGDAVPIVLTIGGVDSNIVTIAVDSL